MPATGLLLVAAATSALPAAAAAEVPACERLLADPAVPIERAWTRHDFAGRSMFRNTVLDGEPAIEAVSSGASGLYGTVDADVRSFPVARWRWRVDRLQPSADLRRSDREDFSAAVFFVFGEPSALFPEARTLVYAWTATPVAIGAAIRNPRHPERIVTIKLEGEDSIGTWREEMRDLRADFRAVFGREPAEPLRFVALFSDDDQTRESSRAFYGALSLSACGTER